MQLGIIKLISSNGKINEHFPFKCAEELIDFNNKKNSENEIIINNIMDSIREIFFVIKLPSLDNNLFWKDNLLEHLINSIEINYLANYQIYISKNYILNTINNLNNYSDEILFRNLSLEKRKKLSKKEIEIIFPLKISDFIKNPNEMLTLFHYSYISFNYNINNLVENDDSYLPKINWQIKTIGVYYDHDVREEITKNFYQIFQKQKINLL